MWSVKINTRGLKDQNRAIYIERKVIDIGQIQEATLDIVDVILSARDRSHSRTSNGTLEEGEEEAPSRLCNITLSLLQEI